MRVLRRVHDSHGRTRLRLPLLRHDQALSERLADGLSKLGGMQEVQVRAWTGSILCLYDPYELDGDRIIEEVRRLVDIDYVLSADERVPMDEEELRRTIAEGPELARAAARFFKGINADVLRASEGRLDLGMLAALGFMGAGTVEVLATKKLPFPQWFNLAWWAFRMFVTVEKPAMEMDVAADERAATRH